MAIKSSFVNGSDLTYPKLMISDAHKQIVLMWRYSTGVVVHPGSSSHVVGQYSDSWIMGSMKDYHGEVTIRNE